MWRYCHPNTRSGFSALAFPLAFFLFYLLLTELCKKKGFLIYISPHIYLQPPVQLALCSLGANPSGTAESTQACTRRRNRPFIPQRGGSACVMSRARSCAETPSEQESESESESECLAQNVGTHKDFGSCTWCQERGKKKSEYTV